MNLSDTANPGGDTSEAASARQPRWRFHAAREGLIAEAHARPSTPIGAPGLAARITALSGEGGIEADRAHMAALCRRAGAPEPGPQARWCMLDAGGYRLRWERHTEVSTWTFFRPAEEGEARGFRATALDLVPDDWLAGLPGEVMAAAHVAILRAMPESLDLFAGDAIGSEVVDGAAHVITDFRPGPDGFTRFLLAERIADPVQTGRIVQKLFEIESYRLLALLAFPLAGEAGAVLARIEAEAGAAAGLVAEEGGIEADRKLITRLAGLAGEAEALAARTSYRFAAARAYSGIIAERIGQLRERRLDQRQTIDEFMERRLAPAMRTCAAVEDRQRAVIERIARTAQMLNTRVDVATEATNAALLRSMDRRARMQLRLQETVEGLSVAAISYYALGLIAYLYKAFEEVWPDFPTGIAVGLTAPAVVVIVFFLVRAMRLRAMRGDP